MLKKLVFTFMLIIGSVASQATDLYTKPQPKDTTDSGGNIIQRFIRYLDDSNKPKPRKKFDVSFIGGPSYSSDTKFSLGFVAAALYRRSLEDTLTPPSNASLYGQVSTTLMYMVGIRGNHIGYADRRRLNYNVRFCSMPTYFWGIGYEDAHHDSYKTKYKDFSVDLKADFVWRLGETNVYVGPAAQFAYVRALDIKGPKDLWYGQALTTHNLGLGFTASLDTRDNLTAPSRGWLLSFDQKFYPRFLLNGRYNFSSTEFGVNYYRRLWKGSVLASRLHGLFTYGHTPWSMLAYVGGSYTMRGYYERRYRDKSALDLTVELRQHVWRRSGIVVWGGVGTVFPKFSRLRWKHLLPNCGVGYRWEFKKNCNVRLDFGIGRGETGFIFNINEAF